MGSTKSAPPSAYAIDFSSEMQTFSTKWQKSQFDGAIYGINPQSNSLQQNKARLMRACNQFGVSTEGKAFLLAMAMIETTDLSIHARDPLKDNQGDSANHTFFNLNTGMIRDILSPQEFSALQLSVPSQSWVNHDSDEAIVKAVEIALKGVQKWGVDRYVSYVRGGSTGFSDAYDYNNDWLKIKTFKCGLTFIYESILSDNQLLEDNRRVELNIPYV
jgi:hypothetical protein